MFSKLQIIILIVKFSVMGNELDTVIALCPLVVLFTTSFCYTLYLIIMIPVRFLIAWKRGTSSANGIMRHDLAHMMLQILLAWIPQAVLVTTMAINTGYIGKLESDHQQKTIIPFKVLSIIMASVAGTLLLQLVHFLCLNIRLRCEVRDWCVSQSDHIDIDLSNIDQSVSQLRLDESKLDNATKKIKIKYPLYLVVLCDLDEKTWQYIQACSERGRQNSEQPADSIQAHNTTSI